MNPASLIEYRNKQHLKLFSNQSNLGRLPVPDLQSTFDAYLKSLEPICTTAELSEARTEVDEFLQSDQAARLQAGLIKRANTTRNWLESWWLEFGYLRPRYPIAVNVNFYNVFLDSTLPRGRPQCAVAGELVARVDHYRSMFDHDMLQPEYMGKNTPLDMSQFARMWTTEREPAPVCDVLATRPAHDHVVVITRRQFFRVPTRDAHRHPLTAAMLRVQFERCVAVASASAATAAAAGVGMLTAGERDRWAIARSELLGHAVNRATLEAIQTAYLIVVLDSASPASQDEAAALCLAGDGYNRWYDKFVSLIVFANGMAGCNGEHTPVDAPTTNTIFAHLTDDGHDAKATCVSIARASEQPRDSELLSTPPPASLRWHVPATVRTAIAAAASEYGALSSDVAITLLQFDAFARAHFKDMKVSPDTAIQMALQLAYAYTHGTTVATYETAQTRQFLHGRTECVRSASREAKLFTQRVLACESAHTPTATSEVAALLQQAINAHNAMMTRCTNGLGIDRHLLGLRLMASELGETTPIPLDTPVYKRSTTFLLSTSQVHFPDYTGGFSAVHVDGYGVCYSAQTHVLRFSIAGWRASRVSNVHTYKSNVERALHTINALLPLLAVGQSAKL